MWHAKLWEDDFSQQAESSIRLKSVLESIKSGATQLCVGKEIDQRGSACQFQDKERTGQPPFFTLSILLCLQVGRSSDSLFLSSHWSAYLQSPSLEEVIFGFI